MTKVWTTCAAFIVSAISVVYADDLDVYIHKPPVVSPSYLHLMLDYSDGAASHLCSFGVSCHIEQSDGSCPTGVCFSPGSYKLLGAPGSLVRGDSVSKWDALVAVYSAALVSPEFSDIYIAIMVSNAKTGGTLLQGYKHLGAHYDPTDPSDTTVPATTSGAITGAQKLVAVLRSIPAPVTGAKNHDFQPKESYLEWYRYLNGGRVIHGLDTHTNFNTSTGRVVPGFDPSILSSQSTRYASPFSNPAACSKMFSILANMGPALNDDDLDSTIAKKSYDGLNIGSRGPLHLSDFLERLHAKDRDLVSDSLLAGFNSLVKTWVISDSSSLASAKRLAAAGNSGSPWIIDNPAKLERSLRNAMKQMVSSGAAVTTGFIPIAAIDRAQFSDDLFISTFEARVTPNWQGNVKKLKLFDGDSDGVFEKVIDASRPTPKPGFEISGPRKGEINFHALTFWTDPASLPPIVPAYAPPRIDGAVVARGGSGQKINGFLSNPLSAIGDTNASPAGVVHRQVFLEPATFKNGVGKALEHFDVNSATLSLPGIKADLGDAAMSDSTALDLLRWGRGQDVTNSRSTARTWITSESPHSRPLVVNYGAVGGYSTANPNIRLFMGSGEGFFRAIENTLPSGVESGREVFGIYLRELLGNLIVRKNDAQSSLKMNYGIDGAASALIVDNNDDGDLVASGRAPLGGDEVYVYFGLRRGGNSYYALDVSDPDSAPKMQWKIARTVAGDFDELGMTFSRPVVGKIQFNGSPLDVVIFAGGYHGGWDSKGTNRIGKDLGSQPDTGVGNAIYIVDARTGSLIWKAVQGTSAATARVFQHPDLEDSIPSTVSALRNRSGIIHRLYVGDTGGAMWRVDLPALSTDRRASQWFVSKVAELGNDGSTASSDRRFFHAPDLFNSFDSQGSFDGIVISSGDRAHPKNTRVENYHFYIKDRHVSSGDAAVKSRPTIPFSSAVSALRLTDQSLCVKGTESSCAATLPLGWKIKMSGVGEKGLATPLVDGGKVFFSSYQPAPRARSCEPDPGHGSVWVMNLADGTAAYNTRSFTIGPGIPPQLITTGGTLIMPGSGIDASNPHDPNDLPCTGKLCDASADLLRRVYWRQPGSDAL
ncbi:MAG: pilus assembly protein [Halioglobus sp.]